MNIMKVVKLDIISVKPYITLKNLMILIFLSVLYSVFFESPILVLSIAQMFSILFSSYPFMVGGEFGIDSLFKIMGIRSEEVVKGRYIVSLLFVIIMLIVGMILSGLIYVIYPVENLAKLLAFATLTNFIAVTLIIFIEFPIFFKVGYMKGRTLIVTVFLVIGSVILIAGMFTMKIKNFLEYFTFNVYIFSIAIMVLWVAAFFISIMLSQKYYRQRDF